MRATRWLGLVAPAVFAVTVAAAAVSVIARWPYQFGGHGSRAHMLSDFLKSGTALAPPLAILILLGVSAVLVRRRDAWGTVGSAVVAALSVLMVAGSLGEAFAKATPDVAQAVQAFGCAAALMLAILAVASIRERRAARRQSQLPARDNSPAAAGSPPK
jgi:cellobiose-specific phosphotransferase system component IIC